jgi:hypothetical protein
MPRRYVLVIVPVMLVLLCAGLLFPAIGRVRDAATRMSCAGHFSQMGVALHNYAAWYGDAWNEKPASTRIRFLTCPASDECVRDNGSELWKSPTPLTHYIGVAGVGADAAILPLGHPRAGVFGYDRRTLLKDGFPDGISNTLMLIETANNPGHWAYGRTSAVSGG